MIKQILKNYKFYADEIAMLAIFCEHQQTDNTVAYSM